MDITHDLLITAPVRAVWQATIDIESWPGITPTVTSVERLDEGPLRVGSRARLAQPGQATKVWTVTALRPDELFEWESTVAGVRTVGSHRLRAEGDGCRNTLVITLHGRRGRLLGLLAGRAMRASLRREIEGFRRHAEAAAGPGPASGSTSAHLRADVLPEA